MDLSVSVRDLKKKKLRIGTNIHSDECGIVYSISDPMSKSNINLFYISAFSTDYLFVSEADTKRAFEALKKAKFEINV